MVHIFIFCALFTVPKVQQIFGNNRALAKNMQILGKKCIFYVFVY